jgi:hypothetical protein
MSDDKTDQRKPGDLHQGPDHSAPYPVSRLAPSIELLDLAQQIARADDMLSLRTSAKLTVIADQVKALQKEAKKILEQAQAENRLNHAQCAFRKVPGRHYHLYRKNDGGLLFSMLSPADWKGKPPHAYQGSYRLQVDLSWRALNELATSDNAGE